jgi:hypothetical protein
MQKEKKTNHRLWSSAVIAAFLLAAASPVLADKPDVFPPDSHPYGHSYGQWAAKWWQWALEVPFSICPVKDDTGKFAAIGQQGSVWFLAGNFGGTTVRTIQVPEDKGLLIPILNYFWIWTPGDPPLKEVRQILKERMDGAFDLACEVDGKSIHKLTRFREHSPVFEVTLPADNMFGMPSLAGHYDQTVDDGIYLMLEPLDKGEHTIRIRGSLPDATIHGMAFTAFSVDVTYHLTVTKKPHVFSPDDEVCDKDLADWLSIYWRWLYAGADPTQSKVGRVQLIPLPNGTQTGGTGTPDDPAVYVGQLDITLPPCTPFVLPEFAWVGERYAGYPAVPDDLPIDKHVLLAGVHPFLTIDGWTIMSDANKRKFYVPVTMFDPIVVYPTPSPYNSVAAVFFQGNGFVGKPLSPGKHVIRLYEPFIIPAGAYPGMPAGFGTVYDNTWIITVPPKVHDGGDDDEDDD